MKKSMMKFVQIVMLVAVSTEGFCFETLSMDWPKRILNRHQYFQVYYDHGVSMKITVPKGKSINAFNVESGETETLILKADRDFLDFQNRGSSIGIKHLFGYGLAGTAWRGSDFLSIGIITDAKFIYTKASNITQIGFGFNTQLFWLFNFYIGFGYAYFTSSIPDVVGYEITSDGQEPFAVIRERRISGKYIFTGLQLKIPINLKFHAFMSINFDSYSNTKTSNLERMSVQCGFGVKL